jgi:hypothetical protein
MFTCRLHQAVRTEQAVHQSCRRSASLMMTWVYSCSCGLGQFALEQLRRAADAAERVLDLVGEVADQLAVGLLLFGQTLLARRLQLLVDGRNSSSRRMRCRFHRGHRAIEVQGLRTMRCVVMFCPV